MFSIISGMIEKSFGKAMIIALLVAVCINAFLCDECKILQADNKAKQAEIALVRADNQSLANQLEQANQHILQYQKQVDKLHQQVLTKLTQAEKRTNEILLELENNQSWSYQPVPTGVSRLLNQRSDTVSNSKANSAPLPPNKAVPQPQVRDKNQR
ncbi:hypothetical protein [Glaesserella parasuis]|uniref:hypothetical protein n=1 Tax=Glaesserella parasuis TaxID=738 RepID=UPI0008FC2A0B|nr:hypothetical protein [Glaesserella parasuis]OIT25476.1 hypothetical protein BLL93_02625 [Glaesserella parasuis]